RVAAGDGRARPRARLARTRSARALSAPRRALEGDGNGPRDGPGRARHGSRAPVTATVLVMAKAPARGRVKTRLCPPCTPEQAALLAAAALADTLSATLASSALEIVLALGGGPLRHQPVGVRVVAQCSGPLDRRLSEAVAEIDGPALVIGMDTPQLTPALLDHAMAALTRPGVDAVLGPAFDGGWWCVGLGRPDGRAFLGVPMSTAETCAAQRRRLLELELRVVELPELRDVDVVADAIAVALDAPWSRFATALGQIL